MFTHFFKTAARRAWLLGSLALGLTQVGCAHPVVMEPSVVFSSSIGHGQVYGQMGVPGAVIYGPPRDIYAPPRVIYAPPPPPRVIFPPRVYHPAPVLRHGHDRQWGHDRRDDRRDGRRGHGDRDDWRR
ncbi:MAG: hypothetical protein KAY21_06675 [Limnohabitans sp.]|nr:hypothetical protein [Limnohabitans sp.]